MKLESLPIEILEHVLGSADSLDDLYCFVATSSKLYKTFNSAKKTILASILICELGPALRDAVAVVLIEPMRPFTDGDRKRLVRNYRQILTQKVAGIARDLTLEAVLQLVPLYRDVRCYLDQYASSRLAILGKLHPDAAVPLSFLERGRLAQAIIRSETLDQLTYEWGNSTQAEHLVIVHEFLCLFQTWERHQIADAQSFRSEMDPSARRRCDRFRKLWRRETYAQYRESPQLLDAFERARRWDTSGRGPICKLECTPSRVEMLLQSLVHEEEWLASSAEVSPATKRSDEKFTPKESNYGHWLCHGPSHLWWHYNAVTRRQYEREKLYPSEDALPLLQASDYSANDPAAPPFGWLDGHSGIDCQRWGTNILRTIAPHGGEKHSKAQFYWMGYMRSKWCQLGFAFWDEARAEALKSCLPQFQTGWLTQSPPADEHIQHMGDLEWPSYFCGHLRQALPPGEDVPSTMTQ